MQRDKYKRHRRCGACSQTFGCSTELADHLKVCTIANTFTTAIEETLDKMLPKEDDDKKTDDDVIDIVPDRNNVQTGAEEDRSR